MIRLEKYYENLNVLHLGTEEPRAYFIPYENLQDALSGDRTKSAYFTSLCGEWSYKFYYKLIILSRRQTIICRGTLDKLQSEELGMMSEE